MSTEDRNEIRSLEWEIDKLKAERDRLRADNERLRTVIDTYRSMFPLQKHEPGCVGE